jgi:SAM-dependent methyltransferase
VNTPPPPYDPDAWDALTDPRSGNPAGAPFRRAVELVEREVLSNATAGSRWLDVGCGAGNLTARLAARGVECIGVDLQFSMLVAARVRCTGLPNARLVAGDAARLPVETGSCDGVLAVSVLGGLAEPEIFFREAARVLAPGATLWISASNAWSWSVRVSGLLALLRRVRAAENPIGGPTRFRTWQADKLADALGRSGFEVARFITFAHLPLRRFWTVSSVSRAASKERASTRPPRAVSARNFLVLARRRAPRRDG